MARFLFAIVVAAVLAVCSAHIDGRGLNMGGMTPLAARTSTVTAAKVVPADPMAAHPSPHRAAAPSSANKIPIDPKEFAHLGKNKPVVQTMIETSATTPTTTPVVDLGAPVVSHAAKTLAQPVAQASPMDWEKEEAAGAKIESEQIAAVKQAAYAAVKEQAKEDFESEQAVALLQAQSNSEAVAKGAAENQQVAKDLSAEAAALAAEKSQIAQTLSQAESQQEGVQSELAAAQAKVDQLSKRADADVASDARFQSQGQQGFVSALAAGAGALASGAMGAGAGGALNAVAGEFMRPMMRAPQDVEDCTACRYVWLQVEMDVGNSQMEAAIMDALTKNCVEAQKAPIFYPACQDMYDSADTMIADYMKGYTVNQLCENSRICR